MRAEAEAGPGPPPLRCAGATDRGRVRASNEDRLHVDAERGLLIVVDGVGGHAAGETAAEIAVTSLRARLERATGSPEERIREGITLANNQIVQSSRRDPALRGMACVLTAAVVENGTVTVGHVGDTRLYALQPGRIEKVTHDHSPVGAREEQGELSELEAMRHPRRNEVYRTLGAEEHAPLDQDFIEITRIALGRDGALLLCSDGLTDQVPAAEISRIVERHAPDAQAVVRALVAAANAAGGSDNVTVVIAMREGFAGAGREAPVVPRTAAGTPGDWSSKPAPARAGLRFQPFAAGLILGGVLAWAAGSWFPPWFPHEAPALPQPPHAPSILRVGPGHTYATIGEALGSARAGDTVWVAPGTYRERVRLQQGVELRSEQPREAVLSPPADGAGPVVAVVGEKLASGTIRGFRIVPAGGVLDVGILLDQAFVAVEDVEVSGAREAGIEVLGAASPTVLASALHDNAGPGVVIRAGASPRLVHNLVVRNGRGRGAAAPGILLDPGAAPVLLGNVIADNGAQGVRGVSSEARAAVLDRNIFEVEGRRNAGGKIGGR